MLTGFFLIAGTACGSTPAEVNRGVPPLRVPFGVIFRPYTDTYEVEGADLASVTASLRAGGIVDGKRRFAGYHEWNLRWQLQWRFQRTSCAVTRATVIVESRITLPEWDAPPGADSLLKAQWTTYLAALEEHELGHRAQTLAGAARIREAVLGILSARCDDVSARANAQARLLLAGLRAESERYDAETQHGRTQGAAWPPTQSRWRPD